MNRPAMVELAADVIANAGWSAELRHGEAFSIASLAATIPIMLALARRKLAIAERITSRAWRADTVAGDRLVPGQAWPRGMATRRAAAAAEAVLAPAQARQNAAEAVADMFARNSGNRSYLITLD